jgi:hypothetical protein
MFTRNGFWSGSIFESNYRSFMTELTLLLVITLALLITLRANVFFVFLSTTFQTLPKPPLPTILTKLKLALLT